MVGGRKGRGGAGAGWKGPGLGVVTAVEEMRTGDLKGGAAAGEGGLGGSPVGEGWEAPEGRK